MAETLPYLDLDLDDKYIVQNLNQAINNSDSYYNDVNQYNLKNKRLKNSQMLEGKHLQEHKLYRHQTPYIDNEMYVGIDAIISYVCAQASRSEVYPAEDTPEDRVMAKSLEKYHQYHAKKFDLARKTEGAVLNLLGKYVGFLKLRWNPNYGKTGEIIPEVVDPNHIIISKEAKLGENPRFICHVLKDTVEGLIEKFPEKEEQILREFRIQRKGARNVTAEVVYREVWFTYMDQKDKKPREAVCWYTGKLVLDKKKDPNWLWDDEDSNFLDAPMKPFIPFNLINDGSSWIDKNSPVEQAVPQQDILNKLGRQIIDNLATANGFKVMDSHAMRSEDAQNLTGDPNQLMVVKTKPGQSVSDVIAQLPPQIVSSELIQEKNATVQTIHNILGTPSQFVGSDQDKTKTASEAMMIKNQASGRQDKIVRGIDYSMEKYFNLLTQMMGVWYSDKHYGTLNGGDGNFDYIEMHRDSIKTGMTVCVQAGTTLPFDKARQEAVAMNLVEAGLLSPYDVYTLLHMDQPQKLYDNFVKWKTNPQQLAMDVDNNSSDDKAVIDFTQLMAGKKVEPQDDPTIEYINQLRENMVSDAFLKAKPKIQRNVIEFVNKALDSYEVRKELNALAGQEDQQPPNTPLPPQVQATIPPAPVQGGIPTMGAPAPLGQPPVPQGQPLPSPSPVQTIMQQPSPQPGAPIQPAPGGVQGPNINPNQPPQLSGGIGQITPF